MRSIFALALVAFSFADVGCGPACDHTNLCAVQGQAGDQTSVCNGDDFITCDDNHRGVAIFCEGQPRKAVCGAAGWSFEYAPPPAPAAQ